MVRNYAPDPVPPEALDRIVDAGLSAPSAGYSQGMGFVIVTDAGTRNAIAMLAEGRSMSPPASIHGSRSAGSCRDNSQRVDLPGALSGAGQAGARRDEIDWPVPYWWVGAGAAMMAVLAR